MSYLSDNSLEEINKTNQDTIKKSIKTLELLDSQKEKLNKADNNISEIDSNLSYSQIILNKMSSIYFNLKSKFNKESEIPCVVSENQEINQGINQEINQEINQKNLKSFEKKNNLSKDLSTLKNLGLIISDELDNQNNLILNLQDKVEHSQSNLQSINYQVNTYLER